MNEAITKKAIGTPTGRLRPTKEEAIELSMIMSTPPSSDGFLTPIRKSRQEEKIDRRSEHKGALTTSSLVSPDPETVHISFNLLPTLPKIKTGPPYESSLPLQISSAHQKKFSLRPRSSLKSPAVKSAPPSLLTKHVCHHGLGPFLSNLPESILAGIVSFIDHRERHPKLFLISRGMSEVLASPDFFLEIKQTHRDGDTSINFNEFLFVVGGKYPVKVSDMNNGESSVEDDGDRLPRRMPFRRNDSGIMGYDPKKEAWTRFGGDPLQSNNLNELHPLSPFGVVDAKPLYLGHPHYSIMFFGGTFYQTGLPSNRVIAYSFLTARWENYPEMMRARHGEDFVLARVECSTSCNDSVVLINCELEFCDCLRCNPPPTSADPPDVSIDMISFADELDEKSAKMKTRRDNMQSMRKCEILDLKSRTWTQSQSSAPFCPPDDGGVAVVKGRYVFMPGTCPPPPRNCETTSEIVTPSSQSETNSYAGLSQSPSSSIGEMHYAATDVCDQLSTTTSMDIERDSLDDDVVHYRPGLVYDACEDEWSPLPPRQFVTTSNPTTTTFRDRVLVLGGYKSSSENALSCYRHREEESILDYEDHLDYAWHYNPLTLLSKQCQDPGDDEIWNWQFGGGTTMFGHRQAWAFDNKLAAAVAAAAAPTDGSDTQMPNRAPVPVRGASATTYQGRLCFLGGLSTFSRTFYDMERKDIYQWFPETCEWRRACMQLPLPALLDGYSFSVHI